MRCPTCGAAVRYVRGPGREHTCGTVTAAVEHRPRLVCPAGHDHPAPDTDIDAALRACAQLVPAARAGRLRGDRCQRCREPLIMPVRRTVRTVPLEGVSPVGVLTAHVDLPSTRCPACGMDQVPGRSQADLATALRVALAPDEPATPPAAVPPG